MLEEAERQVLVHRILLRQDERHLQHALAVERHPRRAVGLIEIPASRQRRAPIEDADVVESEESTGEHVAPLRILAIDRPSRFSML